MLFSSIGNAVVHDENAHQVTGVPGENSAFTFLATPRQMVDDGTHGNLTKAVKKSFKYLK